MQINIDGNLLIPASKFILFWVFAFVASRALAQSIFSYAEKFNYTFTKQQKQATVWLILWVMLGFTMFSYMAQLCLLPVLH